MAMKDNSEMYVKYAHQKISFGSQPISRDANSRNRRIAWIAWEAGFSLKAG